MSANWRSSDMTARQLAMMQADARAKPPQMALHAPRQSDGQRAAQGQETPAKGQIDALPCQFDAKTERELQKTVENWLMGRGYRRLTAENAEACLSSCAGWFGHWTECKRNPLMPDLPIFNREMTACLMLELKVGKSPRYQPGQRESIDSGRWTECRTLDAVISAVYEWEAGL